MLSYCGIQLISSHTTNENDVPRGGQLAGQLKRDGKARAGSYSGLRSIDLKKTILGIKLRGMVSTR